MGSFRTGGSFAVSSTADRRYFDLVSLPIPQQFFKKPPFPLLPLLFRF